MSEVMDQTQAGYLLQGLNARISEVVPEKLHHNVECWMEDVELVLSPKNQGQGRDIGKLFYTAVFSFERFPFKKFQPAVVMASVMGWLMDFDDFREKHELKDPVCDVEKESDDTAIMTIEIEFVEPLMVVKDPNGLIQWDGLTWSLAPYEIWVAENIDIFAANNPAATVSNDQG